MASAVFTQPPIGTVGLTEAEVTPMKCSHSIEALLLLSVQSCMFSVWLNLEIVVPDLGKWLLQALETYGDIDVYTSNFRPMKATISGLGNRTFMKIIVDAASNVVVGVHMCGDDAPEVLQVKPVYRVEVL